MNYAQKIPLKWKVILGVTLTSTLSVILAIMIFASIETRRLEQTIVSESEVIAQIIGSNSVRALAFSDTESGLETLAALKSVEQIREVIIYDESGDPFVWYHSQNQSSKTTGTAEDLPAKLPNHPPAVGISLTDTEVTVVQKIKSKGSQHGTIYMLTDFDMLAEIRSTYITITFWICLGVALFSLVLAMLIQRNIAAPINEVVSALRDMAEGEGDLTRRLTWSSNDELGQLVTGFNTFVEKIHKVVSQFRDTANELSTAATNLNSQSTATNNSILDQQNEIDLLLKAMREMSTMVQEVADSVQKSARDAEQADAESKHGREVVDETMQVIEELANDIEAASQVITKLQQDTDRIGTVLDVIRGIAEQTNLLALNAAIEAARAGELGRGFAVVADEVRTLASRTQESTQEIHDMIESLQTGSRQAVQVMDKGRIQAHASVTTAEKARTSLVAITQAVGTIKDVSKQIATASSEQHGMTTDINGNIVNISNAVRKTSEGSKEMTARAEELDQLSNDMLRLVGQFKL